jgi:CheY-like chemotaxis protein
MAFYASMVSVSYCLLIRCNIYDNIVYIDVDTPSNLKMLRRLLKIKGVASDGAVNGLEATVTVAARTDPEYTLIFMDYTMPIMK